MHLINRIAEYFTDYLVFWVVIAVAAAYFFPQAFIPLKPFIDWFFAATMFGIGALLSVKDFEPIFKKPRLVILGILAQFTIMPLAAVIIVRLLDLPPALAFGLILAGAVPDAMAAGVMSYIAEADVALSVALTTGTTLISPVVTPALMYFFAHEYVPIQFWPMMQSIMLMVIVPLFLGLTARHYFKRPVEKMRPVFPAFSTIFIAFICGLVVALNRGALGGITVIVFISVVLLNISGLVLGYGAGILFKFNRKQRRTLAIGVGMQNAGLGAVLAIKYASAEAAIPNALFATWCIISAAVLASIWNRMPDPAEKQEGA
ncbi:MAG: bile acid:sodium symporter family protein [Candidatus Omnitrophica bacterium]|nr:bile acid:sodium symporter family protein [Candidatus Omnitrophota bacterium]MDD5436290.1 bile acid:sodium symporter family protein [Candidatus Omnitrophota bacterium]